MIVSRKPIEIMVKKLHEDSHIPSFGSDRSAGADLYAYLDNKSVVIPPHSTVKIGSGVSFALPMGFTGFIFARSGLATNDSLRPANCVGVCDNDYRGEYIVPLHNDSDEERIVMHGDRIGQVVFLPVPPVVFVETDDLDDTERGAGGFGSTGK